MILSVVTGTFNRLEHLIDMVRSVRDSVPTGLDYEIVVVDGGSQDGTLEWCKMQRDIRLIEHGELKGAIRAFCDGANAARGEYVLLANDDVTFKHNDAIMRAIVHLEKHPTCGAVAFADNRPAPGYGLGYKVQTFQVVNPDGSFKHVPYAQVGLFRRELGEAAGWWGADDPIMGKARTYGGDNYLSARIWEMGYTVDQVDYVQCNDNVVDDDLRRINVPADMRQRSPYYERYPVGPRLPVEALQSDDNERLRILYLPIYEKNATQKANKRGLRAAFQRRDYLVAEIDYINHSFDLRELVDAWQPDILFTQLQGANEVTPGMLAEARKQRPDMLIINWNGDAHLHGLTTPEMLALLRFVDLQLVVNASALAEYARHGIPAAYWQIGYEESLGDLPTVPSHDVLFLGNCYNNSRQALERTLKGLRSLDVGLYGKGWSKPSGETLYDFAAGAALYQNCKIAIGDTFVDEHGNSWDAFVSNRLFQALAAGAFVLHQHVPRLEEFTGLIDGVHYVSYADFKDMKEKIKHWLKRDDERREIAAQGQAYVRENYSFDAQIDKLFDMLEEGVRE